MIYISHHLEETFQISDRITVLRDGHHISTQPTETLNVDKLIRLMVGRDLSEQFPEGNGRARRRDPACRGAEPGHATARHQLHGLCRRGAGPGRPGRALAGRNWCARSSAPIPSTAASSSSNGKPVTIKSSRDAVNHGIGLLTEDRKRQGLVPADERARERHDVGARAPDPQPGDQPEKRDGAGAGVHRQSGDQDIRPGPTGDQSVRRHAAKGGTQQMAGHQPRGC